MAMNELNVWRFWATREYQKIRNRNMSSLVVIVEFVFLDLDSQSLLHVAKFKL